MTALEALAWTVPPSLAAVACAWAFVIDRKDRAWIVELQDRIKDLEVSTGLLHDGARAQEAEQKRLTEQVSLLADRYR